MNFKSILDCLPCGLSNHPYAILGLLAGVLSFLAGIVCLFTGSRSLGAFLVGAPVALVGLLYLWVSVH